MEHSIVQGNFARIVCDIFSCCMM